MTVVWVSVGIGLIALVVALVVMARRRGVEPAPAPAPAPALREGELDAPIEAKPAESTPESPPAQPVEPKRTKAEAAEPEPEKVPLSAAELRAQVESALAESDRLLGELQELSPGEMVSLLSEGLQEVRSLAGRDEWSQARDKGEALRAQLALMVQSARRAETS